MKFIHNLKISHKMVLISLLVSILLATAFFFGNLWIRELGRNFRSFADKDQVIALAAANMYAQGLQSEQATRNILLNPMDEKAAKNYNQSLNDFENAYQKAQKVSGDSTGIADEIGKIPSLWSACNDLKQQVQSLAKTGKQGEALTLLVKEETPKWRELREIIIDLQARTNVRLHDQRLQVDNFIQSVAIKSAMLFFLIFVLVVGLLTWFSLSMRYAMRDFIRRVREIAEGDIDLTRRIDKGGKDEFGELALWFNRFVQRLHDIIERVTFDTVKVASASNTLYTNSHDVAAAAEEAVGTASSVATASEQMATTSNDIARNCQMAADSANRSRERAEFGSAIVKENIEIMDRLAVQVKDAAKTIEELGTRSDQIGTIIRTIEEIADQTNLLALNAAIEAARAGEQGRGFAVVADEVRALAERTTRATREIGDMIKTIQKQTKGAVVAMEQGVGEVEKGTEKAARSGEALNEILEQTNSVTTQVNQIAAAAEQQTATTSEITNNIHFINTGVIGKTSEMANESATEANDLNKLAEDLQLVIKVFHTYGSDIHILEIAKNDHKIFVNKIRAAIQGAIHLDTGDVVGHHECRFGKWYDNEGRQICGHLASFKSVDIIHAKLHSLSKKAVAAANSGDRKKAEALFQEIEGLSRQIIEMLDTLREEFMSQTPTAQLETCSV